MIDPRIMLKQVVTAFSAHLIQPLPREIVEEHIQAALRELVRIHTDDIGRMSYRDLGRAVWIISDAFMHEEHVTQRERLRDPDGYVLTGPLYDDLPDMVGLFESIDEAAISLLRDVEEWNSDLDGDEPEKVGDHKIEPVWIGNPLLSAQPEPEEREELEAYVPSHWYSTLMTNPNWIVGMTLEPDDSGEWVRVKVIPVRNILGGPKDE